MGAHSRDSPEAWAGTPTVGGVHPTVGASDDEGWKTVSDLIPTMKGLGKTFLEDTGCEAQTGGDGNQDLIAKE